MGTLDKLHITEGMTVDYVKQHGNKCQKIVVNMFDADKSGDFKGNEVELFNNCTFKLEKDEFTIYDKQLPSSNNGGGKIVIKCSRKPEIFNKVLNDHTKRLKYYKDNDGFRHFGDPTNTPGPMMGYSFDDKEEISLGSSNYHRIITDFKEIKIDGYISAKGVKRPFLEVLKDIFW